MELKEKLFSETQNAQTTEIKKNKEAQPQVKEQKDGKTEIVGLITSALEVSEEVKTIMNKIEIETYYGKLSLYESFNPS